MKPYFPSTVVGLLVLVSVASVSAQTFSKEAMLKSMAHEVIVPAYTNLAAKSAALADVADRFSAAPSPDLLSEARRTVSETLLAWKSASCVLNGPAKDLDLVSKFAFWPARAENVEALLAGSTDLTREAVSERGVTTCSLYVLEYLLFSEPGRGGTSASIEVLLPHFQGERGSRRLRLLTVVARIMSDSARQLADAWSSTHGNYSATFAATGQESVGWLVNDLVASVEEAIEKSLFEVREFNPAASPQDLYWIQGAPSGTSLRSVLASLRAAGSLAAQLEPQLRSAGSPVSGRLPARFAAAIAAVEAISGPIETALPARRSEIEAAHQEGKQLEILLKTEFMSALGVTLTFISGDGD